MILERFKLRNIDKKTEKLLKVINCDSGCKHQKISSILLCVEELHTEIVLKNISKQFKEENIEVLVFCNERKDANSTGIIERKDFDLFGKLKNNEIKATLIKEFDMLINYSIDNTYLNNVVAQSKTNFKVGFHNSNEKLYDLMIDVEVQEFMLFNDELRKYLKILNKI